MQALRKKFRSLSQKSRARWSVSLPRQPSPQQPSLKAYVDEGTREREEREEEEEEVEEEREVRGRGVQSSASSKPSSGGPDVHAWHGTSRYSLGRADSFGRGVRPSYPRHSTALKRSESSDTLSSQSTLVPRPSFLESEDHPLGIADLIHESRPPQLTLTQSRVWAHEKRASHHRQFHHYHRHREKEGKGSRMEGEGEEEEEVEEEGEEEEEEEEGREEDGKTIEGMYCARPVCVCVCVCVVCVCVSVCV